MADKIVIWKGDEYKIDLEAPAGKMVLVKDGDNFVPRLGLDKLLDIILFEGVSKTEKDSESKDMNPKDMNIYLDVEGTVLDSNLKPANYLKEFLEIVLEKHDVFWLTNRCQNDSQLQPLINHLSTLLPGEYIELFKKVKPTNWQTLKTEAIDFSKEFLWLDDNILGQEQEELKKRGKLNFWIKIDLVKNPNQFLYIIEAIV